MTLRPIKIMALRQFWVFTPNLDTFLFEKSFVRIFSGATIELCADLITDQPTLGVPIANDALLSFRFLAVNNVHSKVMPP